MGLSFLVIRRPVSSSFTGTGATDLLGLRSTGWLVVNQNQCRLFLPAKQKGEKNDKPEKIAISSDGQHPPYGADRNDHRACRGRAGTAPGAWHAALRSYAKPRRG